MIWFGALFDFLDGLAARFLKQFSTIGKDLDSLADLITFCFLPGTIIYLIITQNSTNVYLPYTGYLLVIFGALRLAKFNNDARQENTFYGLPVPASAIFVSALPFIQESSVMGSTTVFSSPHLYFGITLLLSFLMISDIPLLSLKFKNFTFKPNWHRYLLLIISIALLFFIEILALPIIILLYVVLSMALKISE